MVRWRDAVSTVQSPTAEEARPRGSLGLLKQSVTGFMAGTGHKVDPDSPGKRTSWFSRGSRHRSSLSKTAGATPGPSQGGPGAPESDSPGPPEPGSGASSPPSPGSPGSSQEEFAVASQLLEGIYGKRLDANEALDLLAAVPEIGWLVECYCLTPVQPGWRKSKVAPGDVPLYADEATGKVFEAMPCIRDYMRLAECALQARQKPETAAAAAASLQHHVQSLTVQVRRVQSEWSGPHGDAESEGSYYHNAATGVSTWEDPTHCTKFVLSVAEQLMDSDAFPGPGPAKAALVGAAEEQRAPKSKPEDPWLALQRLEDNSFSGRSVVVEADAFLSTCVGQATTATPSPVQLPATSPKAASNAKRVQDVRKWQPQVPRFDSSRLSEEVANLEKSPMRRVRHIPFRSATADDEAQAGNKLADVRTWKPDLIRCESSTQEDAARGSRAAETAAAHAEPAPAPFLRGSAEVGKEADLRGSPEAFSAPLPPAPSAEEASEAPAAPLPPAG